MPKNKRVMDLSAHTPRTRSRGPLVSGASDDRGFMIIEVIVSSIVLVIVALGTLAVIDNSGEASAMNRARSVASALAQRDQDEYRQIPWVTLEAKLPADVDKMTDAQIAAISIPISKTKTIDGRQYAVDTVLSVVNNPADTKTGCLAGWPRKRVRIATSVKATSGLPKTPITMTTYRAPNLADGNGKGSIIVQLANAKGKSPGEIPVKWTPDTGTGTDVKTSATDGCAVMRNLDPASGTLTWGIATPASGEAWVDENGARVISRRVTVAAGRTEQLAGRYDKAKAVTVNLVDDAGNPAIWNNVSAANGGITSVFNGVRTFPKNEDSRLPSSSFTVDDLFPFEAPYALYAGSCGGNNPTAWSTTGVDNSIYTLADVSTTKDIVLPRVTVKTVKADGTTASSPAAGEGWEVFVTPDDRVSQMGAWVQGCKNDGFYPSDKEEHFTQGDTWNSGDGSQHPYWWWWPGWVDNVFTPVASRGWGPSIPATTSTGPPATQVAQVPNTDPTSGTVTFALPYGIWRVCIQRKNTGTYGTPGSPDYPKMWRNFNPGSDMVSATSGRIFNLPGKNLTDNPGRTLVANMEKKFGATEYRSEYSNAPWISSFQGTYSTDIFKSCANGW